MTNRRIPSFKTLLPLIVSVLLLAYVISIIDADGMAIRAMAIPIWALAAIVIALIANICVVTLRLSRILAHLETRPGFRTILRANVSGLVSSLFMFSLVGSIVGRQYVLRRDGIRASAVAILTAYERMILVFVGGFLFSIGALVLFGGDALWQILTGFPIIPMILAICVSALLGYGLSKSRFERQMIQKALSPSAIWRATEISAITLLGQVLSISTYVILLHTINPEVALLNLFAGAAIVSFAASFPLSVNGWGVREVASVFVFGTLGFSAVDAFTVSVLIGLCSTVIVVAASPVLWAGQHGNRPLQTDQEDISARSLSAQASSRTDNLIGPISLALPLVIGVLLFFQVSVAWNGGLITLNLADPFAVIGLLVVALTLLTEKQSLISFSRPMKFWLIALTGVLVLGFAIGVSRYGVTPWALNNRLVGWLVLMGYLACGAMLVGSWGRHGTRRLGEVIVATAACVVVMNMWLQAGQHIFGLQILIDENFQGFSANRNTFSFQLIIALCFALVYSQVRQTGARSWVWIILIALILHGLWQAQSRTGLLVTMVILALCLGFRIVNFRTAAKSLAVVLGLIFAIRLIREILVLFVDKADELQRLARAPEHYNPESLTERWYSLSRGIEMWLDFPIFGAGLGAFNQLNLETTGEPLVIHSVPVWVMAEFGLVGALVVVSLPAYGLWKAIGRYQQRKMPTVALPVLFVVAFAVFGLVHEIAYQRIFWLVLGAGLGLCIATHRYDRSCVLKSITEGVRPLKVLHVITSLNRGGAETMLQGLVKQPDTGLQHSVTSLLNDGALTQNIRNAGVPVHELGFPNPWGLITLARLIRQQQPDIVQGWMYHGDLAALISIYLSGRRAQTKLVWGIRCSDMDLSRYSRVLQAIVWTCARLSRLPDSVVANSEAGRNVHQSLGYVSDQFGVIRNGIDTQRFSPVTSESSRLAFREQLGLPEQARVVALIARVDPMKDHEGLMRAVRDVPDLWLLLVGRGTEELAKQDRVIALGQRGDIPDLLGCCDGIVSSSAYGEGFSNALAEGMASGLVPIATDVGDSRFIAESVGWVVPPENQNALSSALQEFQSMTIEEMERRKIAARSYALEHFALSAAVDRFQEHYLRVLTGR